MHLGPGQGCEQIEQGRLWGFPARPVRYHHRWAQTLRLKGDW